MLGNTTLSPMVVTVQYIKQNQPKGKVVFIGPCIAKKSEMLSDSAVECKKALTIANAGRLTENLLEGMVCEGGCIGGPATIIQVNNARRNLNRKLKDNDISSIWDNIKKLDLLS